MKSGSWIITILAILAAAGWFGYEGLTVDPGAPISKHGYNAMALGIFFSIVIGVGLMALVFYGRSAGYDEPPHRFRRPGRSSEE